MSDKRRKPAINVPMDEQTLKKVNEAAEARHYKSTAAFVRDLLAQELPELAVDLKNVEWGGYRKEIS